MIIASAWKKSMKTSIKAFLLSYDERRGGEAMNVTNRLRPRNEKQNPAAVLGKTLFLMYLISGILLVFLAFFLYKFDLSEAVIKIGTIAVYIISGFLGGSFIGKQMQEKKYIWGLIAGSVYFLLLLLLSLVAKQGMGMELLVDPVKILATLILCAVSGMAGGMLS